MTHPLSVRHQLIGTALRRYRESLGYTLGDAAQILDCHPSKISRVETGERSIRPKELRELLAEYGAPHALAYALATLAGPRRQDGWWTGHESALQAEYLNYLIVERAADGILLYAAVQVPDLLQGTAYARAAVAADPGVPEDSEDAAVQAALARQRAILRPDGEGPAVSVVIGEAALRQQAGDASLMSAQVRRLITLAEQSTRVTIQVLPFTAGLSPAGNAGGFTILQFGQFPDLGLVHAAGPAGGTCIADPDPVAAYLSAYTHLRLLALTPQESVRWLWQVANAYESSARPGPRHEMRPGA
jgi:transcriptional regulator with XRE-family HTH domain